MSSSLLRTLLILGRTSNVPTVWSNCLAGWLLGGAGSWPDLIWLCAAAALLYVGGMYLNDAVDAPFDREHRPERPIPSGAISEKTVWTFGFVWLGLGLAALIPLGFRSVRLGLLLAAAILIYDALHKRVKMAPLLMALCRFLLYLLAAATGAHGIEGLALWSALALSAYIIGLSYLARHESTRTPFDNWPVYLLAVPVLLAFFANAGSFRFRAAAIALVFTLWVLRALRFSFWTEKRNIGRTVSSLLAGIVLVDCLAAVHEAPLLEPVFALLFLLALLFQRVVPPT